MKYLIGSKLLGLTNEKDKDYVIISTEYEHKKIKENEEDILYSSKEHLLKRFFFEDYQTKPFFYVVNYQFDKSIIGQDFPIEYNLLDYKDKLIEFLKWIVINKRVGFLHDRINNEFCLKMTYHVAYNVFILLNNNPIINDNQKAIIQKIHDGQMPIDYLNELEEIILNF